MKKDTNQIGASSASSEVGENSSERLGLSAPTAPGGAGDDVPLELEPGASQSMLPLDSSVSFSFGFFFVGLVGVSSPDPVGLLSMIPEVHYLTLSFEKFDSQTLDFGPKVGV